MNISEKTLYQLFFKSLVPCIHYIAEDNWKRSNQSLFDPKAVSPLCDSSIATTWYRFTSNAGGVIPQACPAVNSCGMLLKQQYLTTTMKNLFLLVTKHRRIMFKCTS